MTGGLTLKIREEHGLGTFEKRNGLFVKRIDKELPMPFAGTADSVGMDLYVRKDVTVPANGSAFLDLNLIVKPPEGYYSIVVPRSSMFKKTGLILTNSVGVIDPDYCGAEDEIRVCVYNVTSVPVEVKRGARLFQLILMPIVGCPVLEVDTVEGRSRGGYGSTD